MRSLLATVVLCAEVLSITVIGGVRSSLAQEFGYVCETCPTNWGNLDPSFSACIDGSAQSPIAFDRRRARAARLPVLAPRFRASELEVERPNTTNFEAFVQPGSSVTYIGNRRFELVQFHFHSRAEHVINGERAPLELHLVHQAEDGALAVIGVFVKAGRTLDALSPLIEALPQIEALEVEDSTGVEPVDVARLLPRRLRSFRYTGSTTTPPCSEGVSWVLLDRPLRMAAEQIEAIQTTIRGFNEGFDNNPPGSRTQRPAHLRGRSPVPRQDPWIAA